MASFTDVLQSRQTNMHQPSPPRPLPLPKKKYSSLNKDTKKEIIIKARLKNKYFRCRSNGNKKAYSKDTNYCAKAIKKVKKSHCVNLKVKDVKDNKNLCQTIKLVVKNNIKSSNSVQCGIQNPVKHLR